MKIFERIVDRRIRDVVQRSTNQCGFVSGCGTVDVIHAVRLLLEKHREKQKPAHFAFLDLERLDRVPTDVIWYALRQHGIPEELIENYIFQVSRINSHIRWQPKVGDERTRECSLVQMALADWGALRQDTN
ncbi:unnamed protein product [Heligmosomoides polygyrus]|uniref:Reverse transcriptase domain-containing protein n=1 Tax=Heligmosomoides polygyrus TaxID=6339 RepID=A0A183F7E7_HELPZ|nr:unnamed protein product [Heligmosomoides polygyrus]